MHRQLAGGRVDFGVSTDHGHAADRPGTADTGTGPDSAGTGARPDAAVARAGPEPADAGSAVAAARPGPDAEPGARHRLLIPPDSRPAADPRRGRAVFGRGQWSGEPEASWPSDSARRRREARISSSASCRPTHVAPSTDLPGSSSL